MSLNTPKTSLQEQASHADQQTRLGRRSFMAGLTGVAALGLGSIATGRGAATGVAQHQQLLADDGAANDEFGTSVAIDRATETIVVGASNDDNANGTDAGAVYVFTCQKNQFVQIQKLLASDGQAQDFFGTSVAIDGDTIVVGAIGDDENGDFAGAACVFERQGDAFTETQKLLASDGQAQDFFGDSVAIAGDTIVGGAPLENENGMEAGAAYVFERQDGSFAETQKLLASDVQAGDEFGTSVAIVEDLIIVGALFADNENGVDTGVTYVFERQGDAFTETQTLLADDGQAGDRFGGSVAIAGDTIVIGALSENTNGEEAGAAYVFACQKNQFVQTQKLLASDGQAGDEFGFSVGIEGDTIVVGAPFDDNENGMDAGAVYVFTCQKNKFVETEKLLASDGQAGDEFGFSVATDGWIIGGAPFNDTENGTETGAAYVFD
ncbi:FG-GAP repeat protein [Halocatena marina]|uniref:FG-GAP repeat protein n=1 Tax=Halocatena marina TaxID=2934937 RepID=A0ABD5YTV2_9EURY|nr:FG-GAP repeat protein [Halocatena marina]